MAVLWWCHVKSLISWHFLLLSCHVWGPNQTVFGLLGSQTLFLSLSLPSPDPTLSNANPRFLHLVCVDVQYKGQMAGTAFQPDWTCWTTLESRATWTMMLVGRVFCEWERLLSEKTNGSMSVGLEEESKITSYFKALVTIFNWNIWVKNKNTETKKVKVGSRKLRKNIASLIGLNSHLQCLLLYHTQWQIISLVLKMRAHPSLSWENGTSGVGQVCVTCVALCNSLVHGHSRVKLLVSYVILASQENVLLCVWWGLKWGNM